MYAKTLYSPKTPFCCRTIGLVAVLTNVCVVCVSVAPPTGVVAAPHHANPFLTARSFSYDPGLMRQLTTHVAATVVAGDKGDLAHTNTHSQYTTTM